MKHIYYLPLLLMFIYSCKGHDKTNLQNENPIVPISTQQTIINIPWIDPALLVSIKGC